MAKLLTLQSLVCADPEDWVVGDEAMLEVFVDNVLGDTIRGNLGTGQTLTINRTYTFNSTVDVRLTGGTARTRSPRSR